MYCALKFGLRQKLNKKEEEETSPPSCKHFIRSLCVVEIRCQQCVGSAKREKKMRDYPWSQMRVLKIAAESNGSRSELFIRRGLTLEAPRNLELSPFVT